MRPSNAQRTAIGSSFRTTAKSQMEESHATIETVRGKGGDAQGRTHCCVQPGHG